MVFEIGNTIEKEEETRKIKTSPRTQQPSSFLLTRPNRLPLLSFPARPSSLRAGPARTRTRPIPQSSAQPRARCPRPSFLATRSARPFGRSPRALPSLTPRPHRSVSSPPRRACRTAKPRRPLLTLLSAPICIPQAHGSCSFSLRVFPQGLSIRGSTKNFLRFSI